MRGQRSPVRPEPPGQQSEAADQRGRGVACQQARGDPYPAPQRVRERLEMFLERGRDELLDQPPLGPGPASGGGQPELDHLIFRMPPAETIGRHTGDAAVLRQARERWRQQPGRVALEEQRRRHPRFTPTQLSPDRREERIEMILPAVEPSAVEPSAVELSAVELSAGDLSAVEPSAVELAVVEQPDGLPAGRVSGRIGQPEEHAQVRGRSQGRPDILPARRLETRGGGVVWNR